VVWRRPAMASRIFSGLPVRLVLGIYIRGWRGTRRSCRFHRFPGLRAAAWRLGWFRAFWSRKKIAWCRFFPGMRSVLRHTARPRIAPALGGLARLDHQAMEPGEIAFTPKSVLSH
jgi:hypothetical protein